MNDEMSLRVDIERMENEIKEGYRTGNLNRVEMLKDFIALRKRQLKEIEAKRRRFRCADDRQERGS